MLVSNFRVKHDFCPSFAPLQNNERTRMERQICKQKFTWPKKRQKKYFKVTENNRFLTKNLLLNTFFCGF